MKLKTWNLELKTVLCPACDWAYLAPVSGVTQLCPHCYQAELSALATEPDELIYSQPPEAILPFTLPDETLLKSFQKFADKIPFIPADLNISNLQKRLQKIYLPMWLVDTDVNAQWQAEMGYNYDVVSYQEHFNDKGKKWETQELTETRIRWEPRLGRLQRTYHNTPLPALEEDSALKKRLGQYNLSQQTPYQSQTLAATLIRLPNRPPQDAWVDAPIALITPANDECRRAAKADHIREFQWQAEFKNQNWTQLLLPVYSTFYLDDDRQAHPILIHGQNGRVFGSRRASMKRAKRTSIILGLLATVIFVFSLIFTVGSYYESALFCFGGIGFMAVFMLIFAAVAPLINVWWFNRKQKQETWFIPQQR